MRGPAALEDTTPLGMERPQELMRGGLLEGRRVPVHCWAHSRVRMLVVGRSQEQLGLAQVRGITGEAPTTRVFSSTCAVVLYLFSASCPAKCCNLCCHPASTTTSQTCLSCVLLSAVLQVHVTVAPLIVCSLLCLNRILLKSQSGPVDVYLLRAPRCPGPPQPAVDMPHPREVRTGSKLTLKY
jgi:hypothetical protein